MPSKPFVRRQRSTTDADSLRMYRQSWSPRTAAYHSIVYLICPPSRPENLNHKCSVSEGAHSPIGADLKPISLSSTMFAVDELIIGGATIADVMETLESLQEADNQAEPPLNVAQLQDHDEQVVIGVSIQEYYSWDSAFTTVRGLPFVIICIV